MKARTDFLVVREPETHSIAALSGSPQEVINKAIEMATPLAETIRKAGLTVKVGDKEYVRVEGWNILGAMCGVLPQLEWNRKISDNPVVYEARVILVNASGRTIGSAESMASGAECSMIDAKRKCPDCGAETLIFTREAKFGPFKGQSSFWCGPRDGGCGHNFPGKDERITSQPVGKVGIPAPWTRDEFSIRSMCHTRTIGKAYRTTLSWVMKLAGFEPTPLEDMPGMAVESTATVVEEAVPAAAKVEAPIPKTQETGDSGTNVVKPPDTPVRGASTKAVDEGTKDAHRFKKTMEGYYGSSFSTRLGSDSPGERFTRAVNAMASVSSLGFEVESWKHVSTSQWKQLADAAEDYVARKMAGGGDDVATDGAPPASNRWQDNASLQAIDDLEAATSKAAAASGEDEELEADAVLREAKRRAKDEGQRAVYSSTSGLVAVCKNAEKKLAKRYPGKMYVQMLGDVSYFVDGAILDACEMFGTAGYAIDDLTAQQRAKLRKAVEEEAGL